MQLRDHPARDLNNAYQLVGERYQKGRAAERTIYLLDPARVVLEMPEGDADLKLLIDTITCFLQLGEDA
jgi:hypothetical protein